MPIAIGDKIYDDELAYTVNSTMPPQASTEPAGALKPSEGTRTPENQYETKLSPEAEVQFQEWKAQNAPKDSGQDYDLRGAFASGITADPSTGHWPDAWKKPNHPTFSDQSIYAKYAPEKAGAWDGDRYIPPVQRSSIADDFFGTGANDVRPALWHAAEGIQKAFALPGDVLSGKVQAGSVQEIERAADLAMLMVGAPAPVAAKAADGSLGSFMGVKSKTFNKADLQGAQNLEAHGGTADELWENHTTMRGADNRWRQEIDDSAMKLRNEAFDHTITPATEGSTGMWDVGGREAQHTVTLKDTGRITGKESSVEEIFKKFTTPAHQPLDKVIDHPELFEAYPELRGIRVRELTKDLDPTGTTHGMAWGRDLYLAKDLAPEFAKSVIAHEVQHIIQGIEGFSKGGSSAMFKPQKLVEAEAHFNKVREDTLTDLLGKGYTPDQLNLMVKHVDDHLATGAPLNKLMTESPTGQKIVNIVKAQRLIDKAAEEHFEQYQRIKGEVEARNVQARLNYDKFTRANVPAGRTESRSRELQIDRPEEGATLQSGGAGVKYNMLNDIYNKLTGSTTGETNVTETKAEPLSKYPDWIDAKRAIDAGFGYGTGLEPYVQAEVARVYKSAGAGRPEDVIKATTTNEDLTKISNLGLRNQVGVLFAQGALAANRSAIATLGFDPTKINLQTKMGPSTLGGFYVPDEDKTWVNVVRGNESAMVHESVHRGLKMLTERSDEASKILDTLPEETVVRYLMYKTMGDPEGTQGNIDARQREQGKALEKQPDVINKLKRLEEIAADLRKEQRPRGPR